MLCIEADRGGGVSDPRCNRPTGGSPGGTPVLQVHVQILKDFYWKNAPKVLLSHVSWSLTWAFQTFYQAIYGDLWPLFLIN